MWGRVGGVQFQNCREYTFAFAPYLWKPGKTEEEESNNGLALLLRLA